MIKNAWHKWINKQPRSLWQSSLSAIFSSMVSLTTAKLWFLIASSSQWSNGSCRRWGTLLSKHKLYKNYCLEFYKALDILPGCAYYYANVYNSLREFPMKWNHLHWAQLNILCFRFCQHSLSLCLKHLVRPLFECFSLCHSVITFSYVLKLPLQPTPFPSLLRCCC